MSSPKDNISDARQILTYLQFPSSQTNERTALCLLALVDLTPDKTWDEAESPLLGITPMMDWMAEHYAKSYAPNSRESIRRQSIHSFIQAGMLIPNPDDPQRPINSPNYCYKIEGNALKLLRTFGTAAWDQELARYLRRRDVIMAEHAKNQKKHLIPVESGQIVHVDLGPGLHSQLIKAIIEKFAPRYAPNSDVVYIGDTSNKWVLFEAEILEQLNVEIDPHGKMPDVILYYAEKNWLLLIEAVTSHGPVNDKRYNELSKVFESSTADLVYITAFLSKNDMKKFIMDIAWETDVWVADSETHLIHFNGTRFLGPYS